MTTVIDFVDSIHASATQRLDLNDGVTWKVLLEGSDFSPPQLRRSSASTVLAHGDWISATAYANRTVTLLLQLVASDSDDVGTHIQELVQELERPNNILRVQRDGATKPVFFESYRSTIGNIREQLLTHRQCRVDLVCKPFALGLKETLSATVVSNDPATGCYIDVPFPAGDVETPLYLEFAAAGVIATGRLQTSIAVRRRGTPSSAPWILQAESMTLAANTALQANDAAFSGSGQNYVRASSLTSTFTRRLTSSTVFPSSPSVDARGKYRPHLRVRKNTSTGEVRVRLVISADGTNWITPDSVGVVLEPGSGTGIQWIELPVIQLPIGEDPGTDGPTNVSLSTRGIYFGIELSLTEGSSTLDVDCLVLMPADDRYCRILWPGSGSPTSMILDSSSKPKVYGVGSSGETYSTEIRAMDGGTPIVSPTSYNRLWMLRNTGQGAADVLSGTYTVTPYYWPRYLYTNRPSSS